MKVLKRNNHEIIKEKDRIVGINWVNGKPLTCPEWAGGPYTLIENYIDTENDMESDGHTPVFQKHEETVAEEPDFIEVNGVKYYKQ